jgi:transcriptional regulator of arginine metabolism
MKRKGPRQAALLKLVRRRALSSQGEMVKSLEKLGFSVTQASISREVRELGLVRIGGRYVPATRVGSDAGDGSLSDVVNELINSADPVGSNLVVVRTPPGAANTVAADLDQRHFPLIAGTLAGDDTVFVAARSRSAQGRVLALLRGAPSSEGRSERVGSRGVGAARESGARLRGGQRS